MMDASVGRQERLFYEFHFEEMVPDTTLINLDHLTDLFAFRLFTHPALLPVV